MGGLIGGLERKALVMIETSVVAFISLGNPNKTICLGIRMEHFQSLDQKLS